LYIKNATNYATILTVKIVQNTRLHGALASALQRAVIFCAIKRVTAAIQYQTHLSGYPIRHLDTYRLQTFNQRSAKDRFLVFRETKRTR